MMLDQTVDAGTTITMTANLEIVLRVGASIIKIDPTGIMINAPTVTIQSLGPLALHGTPVAIG
jgi:type VI secretion system secreted protein VgrG